MKINNHELKSIHEFEMIVYKNRYVCRCVEVICTYVELFISYFQIIIVRNDF